MPTSISLVINPETLNIFIIENNNNNNNNNNNPITYFTYAIRSRFSRWVFENWPLFITNVYCQKQHNPINW
jgi:hypothetical protein